MKYLAVAIGGFFGAISRYVIGQWFLPFVVETGFPWGTLAINLIGCFVLALFLTLTLDFLVVSPVIRLGVSTGFLGAFTTFSTFALESIRLLKLGHYWAFWAYLFSSLLLSIAMSAFGLVVARAVEQYWVRVRNRLEDQTHV